MSKPITRIVISVLISLAVIAVIFTSVQAAFPNAGVSLGRAHVDAGLKPDLSHSRASIVDSYIQLDEKPAGTHDCGFDSASED